MPIRPRTLSVALKISLTVTLLSLLGFTLIVGYGAFEHIRQARSQGLREAELQAELKARWVEERLRAAPGGYAQTRHSRRSRQSPAATAK